MRALLMLTVVLIAWSLAGCSTVGYYSQIVTGHMKIVIGKQPIEKVLADENTDDQTRHRLQVAIAAREFAVAKLGLPDNNSYSSYYDTGRDYVTWNVVAASEFSLTAKVWCFPVAGCVSYRGYYALDDATQCADELAAEGMDVSVGGATAYSTLGWFDDPLLNTILNRGDSSITRLIFHELAHQKLYVKDDSTFNESFATFVEGVGLQLWQQQSGIQANTDFIAALQARAKRRNQFVQLLGDARAQLVKLYRSDQSETQMRSAKAQVFAEMRSNYQVLKDSWDGYSGYDGWFKKPLNNARLVAVGTYNNYVPAFAALFESVDRDFVKFYVAAKHLADMSPEDRRNRINVLQRSSQDGRTAIGKNTVDIKNTSMDTVAEYQGRALQHVSVTTDPSL